MTEYLIEVTQQQKIYITVKAETKTNAIELAIAQQGDITEAYPPEILSIKANALKSSYE